MPGGPPRDPEELEARSTATGALPASTSLGEVELTVADLERSRAYYERVVGLEVLESGGGTTVLGVSGRRLLHLVEVAGARPAPGHTGLYHFALLLPQRADLARWLLHAVREEALLTGLSDHFVSEALYLNDPDGHGIEIYWDRPRETWEGQVAARMTTLPLDVDDLLGDLAAEPEQPYGGMPAGTAMGHVHLKVAAIPETAAFYRDGLGFGLMAQLGAQAAFLGAGGYHHHIGANVWESAGGSPPPDGAAALRRATIVLPDETGRDEALGRLDAGGIEVEETAVGPVVRDPSGNALLLAIEAERAG